MLMAVGVRSLLALRYPRGRAGRICRRHGSRSRSSRTRWGRIAVVWVSCVAYRVKVGVQYCWEVAESEDGEETGLAAGAITDDDKLSMGEDQHRGWSRWDMGRQTFLSPSCPAVPL